MERPSGPVLSFIVSSRFTYVCIHCTNPDAHSYWLGPGAAPTLVVPAKARTRSEHVSRPTGGISLFVLDTGLRRYDELLNGMGFPRTAVGECRDSLSDRIIRD